MALFDGYVAIWDSKYHYDHWRPYTAIRASGHRRQPAHDIRCRMGAASPDAAVSRVRVGARRCVCRLVRRARAYVRKRGVVHDGDDDRATRHADANFRELRCGRAECADSRVRLGWHFRYATDAGLALGRQIARYIVGHYLQKPAPHAATPIGGIANVDGVELEYEVRGQGEPVVLIHGCCFADWFSPMLHETRLADRYRVVTYHRVGYAGSTHVTGEVGLAQQATHLQKLMRHLGIPRAHAVGHSSGGNIALQLALDAPDMVGSLVLLEPALPVTAAASPETPPTRSFVAAALAQFHAGDKRGAVDTFLRGVCGAGYREVLDWVLPGAFDQGVADADTFFGQELPAVQAWSFTREQARRISQPVLAVIGEKVPESLQSGASARRGFLPGCRAQRVSRCPEPHTCCTSRTRTAWPSASRPSGQITRSRGNRSTDSHFDPSPSPRTRGEGNRFGGWRGVLWSR